MADVRAFRAFRYDLGRVGNLGDLVAPAESPTPAINRAAIEASPRRSPYHVANCLPYTAPEISAQESARKAGFLLRDWRADEILVQDSARSLYVCHQECRLHPEKHISRSLLARVRLEALQSGPPRSPSQIDQIDSVTESSVANSLSLLRTTHFNIRPVLALYPDAEGKVADALDQAVGRALPYQASSVENRTIRLWPIHAHQEISNVIGMLGPKPLIIAAGQADYRAALRYRDEQQALGELADEEAAPHFILMMLVAMSDPGLHFLPAHYELTQIPPLGADEIARHLQEYFEVVPVGQGEKGMREIRELLEQDKDPVFGIGTSDNVWQLARLKNAAIMADLLPNRGPIYRELGDTIRQVLIQNTLLAPKLGSQLLTRQIPWLGGLEGNHRATGAVTLLVPPVDPMVLQDLLAEKESLDLPLAIDPDRLAGLVFHSLRVH